MALANRGVRRSDRGRDHGRYHGGVLGGHRRADDASPTGSRRWLRLGASALVALVAAASVGAAAGCASEPESVDFPTPPPATDAAGRPEAAPTRSFSPEEAAAAELIIAAYRGSVEASVTAVEAGDPRHHHLDRYHAGTARRVVSRYVEAVASENQTYTGDLVIVRVDVIELDLTAGPPTATVRACLDNSDYRPVDRDTGEPVPDAIEGGRYMEEITVQRFANDRWMVAEYHPSEESC